MDVTAVTCVMCVMIGISVMRATRVMASGTFKCTLMNVTNVKHWCYQCFEC